MKMVDPDDTWRASRWRQKNICGNCESLEAEVVALKRTIEARDRECKSEHYDALQGCIDETIKLRRILKNVYKLWLDGDWYNDKVWDEVSEVMKSKSRNFGKQEPESLKKEVMKLREAIERYWR